MNHKEAQELLEDYVSEQLDGSVREQLEKHLSGCFECRSILNGGAPVDLEPLGSVEVDERALRRSVRRALWRTAFNAAVIVIAAVVSLAAISNLVLHPLLMNRGDRATAVARATYDIASLFNEGAVLDRFSIDSGVLHRTFTAEIQIPIGAGMSDLGSVSSQLGLFGSGEALWPFVNSDSRIMGAAPDVLGRLGGGTVATVSVGFGQPISVDQAQLLADSSAADVRVVWAGFLVSDADPAVAALDPLRVLGYSTCVGTDHLPPEHFGASSASSGASFGVSSPSVRNALQEVRRAVNHLADNPDVANQLLDGEAVDSVQRVAAYTAGTDPEVETLVVTGPTDEILKFFDIAGSKNGTVLAVGFYNWSGPVCQR